MSDHLRDPVGWLFDALPWPLRRLWLAARLRAWPPDECRLIRLRRPPEAVLEYLRQFDDMP